jgi:hypothetical protein
MKRDVAEIGVADAGAGGLDADQLRARDEHPSVREPYRGPTESVGAFSDHLAVAVQIDDDDLPRSPVREPQPAVVPARRPDT